MNSFFNFLFGVSVHHYTTDDDEISCGHPPYYLVHFTFRSLVLTTLFIYWKVCATDSIGTYVHHPKNGSQEWVILALIPVFIFNIFLSKKFKVDSHRYRFVGGKDSAIALNVNFTL